MVGFALALGAPYQQATASDLIASFQPRTRVLFQGDSITDMNRGRNADPNDILGHSYAFIIATKAGSAYPERGVSGNAVTDLDVAFRMGAITSVRASLMISKV